MEKKSDVNMEKNAKDMKKKTWKNMENTKQPSVGFRVTSQGCTLR